MKLIVLVPAAALALVGLSGISIAAGTPLADAGLDQTVTIDTTVQLDGTGSVHPDGSIESYQWTLRTPDGHTTRPDCRDCRRTQFTPTTPGRYEATLTVTAANGTTATDTLYVHVNDAGPSVELAGTRTPDPDEPVEFTASAESPDAQLAEIAWAIEDQIVAVRPLDGSTDVSELTLAFTDTEVHRVQVVVKDTNGRTAYDQLNVKPQDGSGNPAPSWSEVEPDAPEPDCRDAGDCGSRGTPEPTPEGEIMPTVEDEQILYQTDGYEARFGLGSRSSDSSYVGTEISSVGIDGGENAPWRMSNWDTISDTSIDVASTALFGQERKTISCELSAGTVNACSHTVNQLERNRRTTNVNSPTSGGAYSAYGLTNARRVRGGDPGNLEAGQSAEVTIVIQQEKEGIVDKVLDATRDGAQVASDRITEYGSSGSGGDDDGSSRGSGETADHSDTGSSTSVETSSEHGSSDFIDIPESASRWFR